MNAWICAPRTTDHDHSKTPFLIIIVTFVTFVIFRFFFTDVLFWNLFRVVMVVKCYDWNVFRISLE